MRYTIIILLVFVFTPIHARLTGPQNKFSVIHDFKHEWLTYDQDEKSYIPQITDYNSDSKVHSLVINLNQYPNAFILIKVASKDDYLFFNKTLYRKLPNNNWMIFSVERLKQIAKQDLVNLSFFSNSDNEKKEILACYKINQASNGSSNFIHQTLQNFSPRGMSYFLSGMVLIAIITAIILSFLSANYAKAFHKYYNIRDLFTFQRRENSFVYSKPLDSPNILFIMLLSVLFSFLIIALRSKNINFISENWFFKEANTFGTHFSNFVKIAILIFVCFTTKFFFLNAVSFLFNIEKSVDYHFFKLIQTTLIFISLILLLLLISQNIFLDLGPNFRMIALLTMFIFYGIRTIIIYFFLNQTANVKTLYLISYLCIVEVIPILIGFRMIA